jgi:hypothetical protein
VDDAGGDEPLACLGTFELDELRVVEALLGRAGMAYMVSDQAGRLREGRLDDGVAARVAETTTEDDEPVELFDVWVDPGKSAQAEALLVDAGVWQREARTEPLEEDARPTRRNSAKALRALGMVLGAFVVLVLLVSLLGTR